MASHDLVVRRATPDDADGIVALMREVQALHVAGRPDLFKPGGTENVAETRERMSAPGQFIWVATADDSVVGYAYARLSIEPENPWRFSARSLVLDQMGVKDGMRRHGIGRRLWEAVLEAANDERVQRVILNVWSFNGGARAFYRRLGFDSFHERMAVELATPDDR